MSSYFEKNVREESTQVGILRKAGRTFSQTVGVSLPDVPAPGTEKLLGASFRGHFEPSAHTLPILSSWQTSYGLNSPQTFYQEYP